MKLHTAVFIFITFWKTFACDEVALLQTATAVRKRSRIVSLANVSRNLSSHVADPGIACADEDGWQVATLPPNSIAAGSYCLPPSDAYTAVQNALLAGSVFEEDTHNGLESHLANAASGDFIHGGAFVGDFVPHLSRLAKAGSRVYAFEPEPMYMQATRGTVGESSLTNVFTVEAGMASEFGMFELTTQGGATSPETFVCVRIDDAVEAERPVSLIFLDVDGYELSALQGAAKTLERHQPLVVAAVVKNDYRLDVKKDQAVVNIEGIRQAWELSMEVEKYLSTFGYVQIDVRDDNVFYRVQ